MNIQTTEYTAIVLIRTEEFNQWINEANKKAGVDEGTHYPGDYGTYLVKNVITQKDVENFVAENYRSLFGHELGQWHEQAFWPAELTPDLFHQWFKVKVNREVFLL